MFFPRIHPVVRNMHWLAAIALALMSFGMPVQAVVPQPAIDACIDKSVGYACSFDSPNGTVNGYCAQGDTALVCDPNASGGGDTTGCDSSGVVWYVNGSVSSSGGGTSWGAAFKTVPEGLAAASCGDQVWVAAGTYYPTSGSSRTTYIQLVSGVELYGGFDGSESSLAARDWEKNETILSGDIGVPGDDSDNSVHVVSALDTTDAVIDGFIIEKGYANVPVGQCDASGSLVPPYDKTAYEILRIVTDVQCQSGGGLYNVHANTTVRNVIFRYNTAGKGGAVYNMATTYYDFAGTHEHAGNPYFENVTFLENYATARGGAVNNDFYTTPTFVDVQFIRNHCDVKGGGVYGDMGAPSYFINALFARNTAERAGAVANDGNSSSHFVYTTLFGNQADDIGGALYQGTYMASETGGQPTKANEPHLYDSLLLGNYSDASPGSISNWHDDLAIFDDNSVYETTDGVLNQDDYLYNDYDTRNTDLGWSSSRDSASILDTWTTQFDGETTRTFNAYGYRSEPSGGQSGVIYVDADAKGSNNGASWGNAYTDLNAAINAAASGAEIWVAEGVYHPTSGTDRGIAFDIRHGVSLYGGFAGTEGSRGERNYTTHLTYLDGDIGVQGDDSDNSYHVAAAVITGNGSANTGVLDGFVIRNGHADGDFQDGRGGGILIQEGAAPTIRNNTITDNYALEGGGVSIYDESHPTLTDNLITANSAERGGGMLIRVGSEPTLDGTNFTSNSASDRAGALYIDYGSNPTISNCTISGNSAVGHGGAVYVDNNASQYAAGTNPVFNTCSFTGNSTDGLGGAIYLYNSSTNGSGTDLIISGNSAADGGDGVAVDYDSTWSCTNCTVDDAQYTYDSDYTEPLLLVHSGLVDIDSGSATIDFGTVELGSSASYELTLWNRGSDPLTFSNTNPIQIGGTNAGDFSVQTQPDSSVSLHRSASATLAFTPSATGSRSASVTIANDSANAPSYTFTLAGTGSDGGSSTNNPPTASSVSFSGTLEVGSTLTGSYNYSDADSDPDSGSSYRWYRADDSTGGNAAAIATTIAYTPGGGDLGKYLAFAVTPSDGQDAGSEVISSYQGPISSNNSGNTIGLLSNTGNAADGYTLFAPMQSTTTYLIDNNGEMVHSWPSSYQPGLSVYLLEDGRLLRTGNHSGDFVSGGLTTGGAGGIVELIEWDGTVAWSYQHAGSDYLAHHDVEYLPNGNILMIAWEVKDSNTAVAAGRDPSSMSTYNFVWSEKLIEVNPDTNEIVWEWHAWDHMIQDHDSSKANWGTVGDHPERIDLNYNTSPDWLHFNGIDYNPEFDQILISVHSFSEIWVIDHSITTAQAATSAGDLLYRWGNPRAYDQGAIQDQQLFSQHDAKWIEDGYPGAGNITIYNNGNQRNGPSGDSYSTVEEIEPPVDASGNYTLSGSSYGPSAPVFWTYKAATPTDFYSQSISGAQRLSNGNTLICEGESGNFFEVDGDGNTVWQYINPVGRNGVMSQGDTPSDNPVFRAVRYASDYAGLDGRDLQSRNAIEASDGTAPAAVDIAVSGTYESGQTLSASYTYVDAEGDSESGSSYQWYRADDNTGTNATTISGASASGYILTNDDAGKYVAFAVTPSDGTNTGGEYVGAYEAVASTLANTAPSASSASISGTQQVRETLTGSYNYYDADSDPESGSSYQWYRADSASGSNAMAISNAAAISYTLTSSDEGQYIAFAVTPADGTDSGSTVFSSYVGPIAAAANDIDLCSGETAPSLSNITVANGEIKYCNVTGVITLASNVVCEAGGTLELIGASIQVNSGGLTAKSGCTMTLSTQ